MLNRPDPASDGNAAGAAPAAARPPRRRAPSWWPNIYYGWYMATAGAASNFLVLGITVFGFGVFIPSLRDEMGWTIAQISIAFSLRSFENGLLAPFTGFMVDKLGARRMAFTGLFALVIGLLLFSQSRTIWAFYAASLVMALGQSLGSFTPFSAALMNWFTRQRGRAMGLVSTGNGAGGLAAPVLAAMTAPGGDLALSGILEAQADEIAGAYRDAFDIHTRTSSDGWVRLDGRRRIG